MAREPELLDWAAIIISIIRMDQRWLIDGVTLGLTRVLRTVGASSSPGEKSILMQLCPLQTVDGALFASRSTN